MDFKKEDLLNFLDYDCVVLNYDENSGVSSFHKKSKIKDILYLLENEYDICRDIITGTNTIVVSMHDNKLLYIIFMS